MAAYLDLEIERGATYTCEVLAVDDDTRAAIDLTDYTARMMIKRSTSEAEALLELTTGNGRIIITVGTGSVMIYLTAIETAALDWARGVYDLELVSIGGEVTRLIEGAVTVLANVTV